MSKYGAKAVIADGIRFDSLDELHRYGELRTLQSAGLIKELKIHPPFEIKINDVHVCNYIPDFTYVDISDKSLLCGQWVVEDVKFKTHRKVWTPLGIKIRSKTGTEAYRLKKRLFEAYYNVRITEVFIARGDRVSVRTPQPRRRGRRSQSDIRGRVLG